MISTDVVFGLLNSRTDLGLTFTHFYQGAPETHTEYVEVPGRTPVDLSELIVGEPWYNMREMTIEFEYLAPDWEAEKTLVFASLHGRKMDIRFSADPGWFYTGRCAVEFEVTASTLHVTVAVTADPFKHVYGEVPTTLSSPGNVTNPTQFSSLPLIRVNGSGAGTVTVGNQVITLLDIDGYVDIDSKLMDCYKGLVNCNGDVELDKFPKLPPGSSGITWTGGVTSVEVEGRWRTL